MSARSVVISGLGAVSALGIGVPAIRAALREGRDGLRTMGRFDVTPFQPVHLAGEVLLAPTTADHWARVAAREAWADADAGAHVVEKARIAVVAGTTEGEEHVVTSVARAVAAELGARGPAITISTACASSTNAIGLGRDLLLAGDADLVVAGGAERLLPEMFAGFAALGVLSEAKCAPFGETLGTTLGEGAGFVVLERAGVRRPRTSPNGARHFVLGYGLSGDAWHETTPEPRGEGVARAIAGALGDADLAASSIDYVNAHATGTATNDDAEWRGIQRALGERARAIPVSGQKGFLGHAQGAAGVLELVATLAAAADGEIPPSTRIGKGRPRGPDDPVALGRSRPHPTETVLKASAAFGGANAVLCLGMRATSTAPHPRRRVAIAGWGEAIVLGGAPRDEPALEAALGELAEALRKSDPSCRALTLATRRALEHASIRVRGALRDRAGLFVGATRISPATMEEMRRSIERTGLGRASAAAFSRMVLGAPTGAASRALSLRGPTTTLASEGIAGLLAVALAARALRDRTDADVLVAAAVDERAGAELEEEGAACAVLSATERGHAEILGVGLGGPDMEGAVAAALTDAGVSAERVEVGGRAAIGSLRALLALLPSLRAPVVVGARGELGSVAIVVAPS